MAPARPGSKQLNYELETTKAAAGFLHRPRRPAAQVRARCRTGEHAGRDVGRRPADAATPAAGRRRSRLIGRGIPRLRSRAEHLQGRQVQRFGSGFDALREDASGQRSRPVGPVLAGQFGITACTNARRRSRRKRLSSPAGAATRSPRTPCSTSRLPAGTGATRRAPGRRWKCWHRSGPGIALGDAAVQRLKKKK